MSLPARRSYFPTTVEGRDASKLFHLLLRPAPGQHQQCFFFISSLVSFRHLLAFRKLNRLLVSMINFYVCMVTRQKVSEEKYEEKSTQSLNGVEVCFFRSLKEAEGGRWET